ncbi:MAG: DUF4349 domain-containing protein [Ruminococcaceae bacterium]|nr:DUF4349 domain-containing protein [Oscillospiraceae bacterium]
MKKLSVLSLLLVIAVMFSACGASVAEKIEVEYGAPQFNGGDFKYFSTADDAGIYYTKEESETVELAGGSHTYSSSIADADRDVAFKEEKLVYTSRVILESEDFDAASESLHQTVKSLGGIIVSESAYNLNNVNSKGFRTLSMTVRIPQANYDAFLSGISESYNVASINNSVQNLTESYYDNENRLKSYRIQEERLFAMLEKAENVSEMLEIEARLCDVQYQIEALTNTQTTIDNDVKYATFYLDLNEVTKYTTPTPKTFNDRLAETLRESGEMFIEFLENALFALIFLAPYITILAVFIIVLAIVVKHRRKKFEAKKENKDEK